MDETEWRAATDPAPLLALARPGDRILRLFGVACLRPLEHLLDGRGRAALAAAERFADGRATAAELEAVRAAANEAFCEFDDRRGEESASHAVELVCRPDGLAEHVHEAAWESAAVQAYLAPRHLKKAVRRLARLAQARLARELVGGPLGPGAVDPRWLTPTVTAVATGIDLDQAFDRLPVLADALEDAGCDHSGLLGHCRGAGPHTRGCWVIDRLLGRDRRPEELLRASG